MRVVIRADASVTLGSGHVMRCLTLAEALAARGAEIRFICREEPGNLCHLIEAKGFAVTRLSGPAALEPCDGSWEDDALQTARVLDAAGDCSWLVVDSYALDRRWESYQRPFASRILVIDDLANRPHDCDLLLDQNLHDDPVQRYEGLVPEGCRTLLGPRHALLRQEYLVARQSLRLRDGLVRRILVSFGGSDPTNETEKALSALRRLSRPELHLDVVLGAGNPQKERIAELCAGLPNCFLHCQTSRMAQLMADADLALGSGGATTWERCYLGLPSITVVVAENQWQVNCAAAAAGVTSNLGWYEKVSSEALGQAIESTLSNPDKLKQMSERALALMGVPPIDTKAALIELMTGVRND